MRKIALLGSTGSIGTQTLSVVENDPEHLRIVALASYGNQPELFAEQIDRFQPSLVCVYDEQRLQEVKALVRKAKPEYVCGMEGLCAAAVMPEADVVETAMPGMIGILPTLEALDKGKDIALANKETLVCAGALIQKALQKGSSRLIPVDSEHGAFFQCMSGLSREEVRRFWLTASGGPFRGYTREQLKEVRREEALRHPKWSMGRKITVDSATLVNKGLEMIEVRWLYDALPEQICPVIHPESLIHSMIETRDGSVLAQLGPVDMRLPIQVALRWPKRGEALMEPLDFSKGLSLHFEPIDETVFTPIALAREAIRCGGYLPAVYSYAAEEAVGRFLKGELSFYQIFEALESAMEHAFREREFYEEVELSGLLSLPKRLKKHLYLPKG